MTRRGLQLQPKRLNDSEDCIEAGTPLAREGFVEALARQSGISRDLGHTLGPCNILSPSSAAVVINYGPLQRDFLSWEHAAESPHQSQSNVGGAAREFQSAALMTVTLFIPCFVDLMYPQVGISMVKILERLGHQVECPELACCGQPAFNTGYWEESREVAGRVIDQLKDAEVVVVASGSCGAMMKVFYPELFDGTPYAQPAKALAPRVHEFSSFLVRQLKVTDLGARFPAKVTIHDGCHGLRELDNAMPPRALLARVRDLQLVEMGAAQTCCGFGGTFSAKFPEISTAMGEVKCGSACDTGADYIVSNDSSCLMHIQGLLDRQGKKVKTIHLAEILAQS